MARLLTVNRSTLSSGALSVCLVALAACSGTNHSVAPQLPTGSAAPPDAGDPSGSTRSTESTIAGRAPTPQRAAAPYDSRITSITVTKSEAVGDFGGVPYTRTVGVVTGTVDRNESVDELATLPRDKNGTYDYSSEYEIIAPATGSPRAAVVLLDAENRGAPVMLGAVNGIGGAAPSATTYPVGLGNGFLQRHGIAYARVQWQTGVNASVPQNVQGLGLVIERDFGRFLAGTSPAVKAANGYTPGTYARRVIGGISQSAWFVNTFLAEGFNADPSRNDAVYTAAIAIDGTGNWMPINNLGDAAKLAPSPYPAPNELPLTPMQLLHRPASDPLYVDAANYTDFYRLRAGYSESTLVSPKYRRYDWPSAHAPASVPVNPDIFAACPGNAGVTALNPIGYTPYLRALVAKVASGTTSLPPSTTFALALPTAANVNFNALAGSAIPVPQIASDGMPVGGVRFPEADLPLGRPAPVSIGPVAIGLSQTCANYGGWIPTTASALTARYGTTASYTAAYRAKYESLATAGFVLPEDENEAATNASAVYAYYTTH